MKYWMKIIKIEVGMDQLQDLLEYFYSGISEESLRRSGAMTSPPQPCDVFVFWVKEQTKPQNIYTTVLNQFKEGCNNPDHSKTIENPDSQDWKYCLEFESVTKWNKKLRGKLIEEIIGRPLHFVGGLGIISWDDYLTITG